MKSIKAAAVLCLVMILTMISVFNSGQAALKAYAEDAATAESCIYAEDWDDFDDSFTEDEKTEGVIESTVSDTSTTDNTAYVDFEEEPSETEKKSDEATREISENLNKEESSEQSTDDFIEQDITYYGAYFYILNGIDSELPEEIIPHPRSDYSEGIYIFDSVKESKEISDTDLAKEPSGEVNFADNEVTDNLKKVPALEQIKAVRSDFDPAKHYIQWYVQKYVGYNIHIDGVIRTRSNEEKNDDDMINDSKKIDTKIDNPFTSSESSKESTTEISKPSDSAAEASMATSLVDNKDESTKASSLVQERDAATKTSTRESVMDASTGVSSSEMIEESSSSASSFASIQEVSTDDSSAEVSLEVLEEEEPDIIIEIEVICNNPVVPDDGQPHLVGDGFKIKIIDNKEPQTLIEKIYDAFGAFLHDNVITVSAADGNGTTFRYKNHNFWVNIDAAYAYVTAKDISENGLSIPFWFGGQVVEPGDIGVKIIDKITGVTAAMPSVTVDIKAGQPSYDADNVITVEAGSTVKNDDGKTLTNDSYKIIEGSLKEGHAISKVVFNGSQTGAGESSNEITSVTIVDLEGKDVSSEYVIKLKKGKLILVENNKNTANTAAFTWDERSFDTAVTESSAGSEEIAGYNSVEWDADLNKGLTQSEITVITKERMSSVPGTTVLGARLSATGDDSEYLFYRLAIILFSMIFGISIIIIGNETKNRKRVK